MKLFFKFILILSLFTFNIQEVNAQHFESTSTYGPGSGVSIAFNPTGVFDLNNHFILEISDNTGVFGAPSLSTTLKDLTEFYVPVINGVLPSTITAGTYKLRIRSTLPAQVIYETPSFNVVIGTNTSIPDYFSTLTNVDGSTFNCLRADCNSTSVASNNIYGKINVASGETTSSLGSSTSAPLRNIVCNPDPNSTYTVHLIDISNVSATPQTLTINGANQFFIPNNLPVGTYVIEISKTFSGVTSINSNAFIFHGSATNINNLSSETVCIGNLVNFSIDISSNGIGRNYRGSKYSIDYGDGTPVEWYTHAQLLSIISTVTSISHTYNSVSCSVGTGVDQGYYLLKFKLWNKGVFKNTINTNYCNTYYENGNGADKRVNTNRAPVADFNLNPRQCINTSITTVNTTVLGQYGAASCFTAPTYTWSVKKPTDTDFIVIDNFYNQTWIVGDHIVIPASDVNIPGCWVIKLEAVNSGAGCMDVTTKIKTINIQAQPLPNFTNNPSSPICAGQTIQFTNTSNVVNLTCQDATYSWVVTPVTGTPATLTGYQFVTPFTSTSVSPQILFTQPGSYNVVLSVTNICGTVSTTPRRIDVFGDPTVSFTPNTKTICATAPSSFTIDFSQTGTRPTYSVAPYAPTSYEWTVTGPGVTPSHYNFTGSTTSASAFPIINFTAFNTYTIRVKVNGSCAGSNFADFTFIYKQTPVITNTNLAQTICSGTTTTSLPLTSDMSSGTIFNWTVTSVPAAAISGFTTPGFGDTIPAVVLNNSTNVNGVANYVITPTNNGCTGAPVTLAVTVNPTPVIPPQTAIICSGSAFTISPVNATPTAATIVPANTTYTWTVVDNVNVTGDVDQPTAQTSISQTLTNLTNTQQTVVYTVTPKSGAAGSCVGLPFTITVTVNPTPVVPAQTAIICSGLAFSVTPANAQPTTIVPSGTTYTWTVAPNANVSGQSNQANAQTSISQTLTNLTNIPQTVVYTVTPRSGAAGSCVGSSFTVTVTVNPKPVVPLQSATICSGLAFSVSPANAQPTTIVPSGTTYTWTVAPNTNVSGQSNQANAQTSISQTLTNLTNIPQTVVYTVTPTSGATGSCVGLPFTVNVIVNPTPVVPVQSATICSGLAFSVTPANAQPTTIVPSGTTYTWTVVDNPNVTGDVNQPTAQTSISQTLTNLTPNTVQTVVYTVTPRSGAAGTCSGASFTLTVTVNPTPVIPLQTATICSGGAFAVTPVDATPTAATIVPSGTTYTWTVAPNTNVSGQSNQANAQTSISQTLTNLTNIPQTVVYTVTPASGAAGSCVGLPFTINVIVNPTPVVPVQSAAICSGLAFSVTPANAQPTTIVPSGTTYTWTVVDNPDVSGDVDQPTAQTSISQTLTNLTNTQQTVVYTVTPKSGAAGSCVGLPFTITVTVNPTPVVPAQTAIICSGLAFSVTPANAQPTTIVPSGTTYTWTVAPNANVSGQSNQANAQTSISQTLTNLTNIPQTVVYTVTPRSGAAGSCVGSSFTVTVTVNPKPVVPLQSATICSGLAFSVSPANAQPTTIVPSGTTYTWTVAPNTNVSGQSNQANAQTSISQTLTNLTNIPQTVVYTVTPTSGATGSCAGLPFTVNVIVNPTPVVPVQSATICSGLAFSVSPANAQPTTIVPSGTTYTWTVVDNPNVTGDVNQPTAQTSISQTLTNLTPNTVQTVVYTVTPRSGAAGTCSGASFTLTVTVNPTPVIPLQTATICSGGAFAVTPVDATPTAATIVPSGTTYTWTVAPNANVSGQSNQVNAQTSISQTLTNLTNIPQTVVYTVTPTSGAAGSCVGLPFTVNVIVNPTPVVPVQSATICSGLAFSVTPANAQPTTIVPSGTTYTWTVVDNPDVSGDVDQPTAQTSISQTLTNLTNTVQTVVYTVTPKSGAAGSCVGLPFTITVTVNPTPVVPAQTAIICSGLAFSVTPANAQPTTIVPSGTTYTWTVAPNANVSGQSNQANAQTSISQTLTNLTNIPQTVVYTVTPRSGAAGSCVGSSFTVTVTVNPKPVVPLQSATICSGLAFSVSPANAQPTTIVPSGTTYTWTVAPNTNVSGQSNQANAQTSISQTLTNLTNIPQTVVYTVTPTSGATGSCAGLPFTVNVIVNPTPVVPVQSATICSGLAFSVTPANAQPTTIVPSGTTYTWTVVDNPNVTGDVNQPTAQTSISQTLTNLTPNTVQTVVYTVTPRSGAAGTCSGASFTLTVTVNPTPVIPLQTATICSGGAFAVTPVDATPTAATIVPSGTTYTWTVAPNANVSGQSNQVNAQTSISQTLTNLTNIPQTVVYTVTPASGAAGSCVGLPFTINVIVNPTPVVPVQSAAICSGLAFSVTPANAQPTTIVPSGTTYTWTVVDNPDVSGDVDQPTAQTNISQTLTNLTNTQQTVVYTVTPKSGAAGNCVGLPFTITVTVNPTPVVPAQTATICSGLAFSVTPANAQPTTIVPSGTTYTWTVAPNANVSGQSNQANAQTSISQTLTNLTNIPQTVVYTVTPRSGAAGSCVGSSFTVTVTVNPKPVVPLQSATICSGLAFSVTPANAQPTTIVPSGTTYTWTVVDNVNVTGDVDQPTAQTSISQTLTNLTNIPQTVVYTVTPTSGAAGSCAGLPFTVNVIVNPTPVVPNESLTICGGTAFTINPVDATPTVATIVPSGTTYTWTVVDNPNVTGDVNQPTAQTSISQTLTNLTPNTVQTVVYTVTPRSGAAGNCVGASFTLTVTLTPSPVIPLQSATICSGLAFSVSPANATPTAATIVPSGTTYTWTVAPNANVSGQSNQANAQTSISQTLTNLTNIPQTVVYTVTPTSGATGSCVGLPFTVNVIVNPTPVVPVQSATICSGLAFSVTPANAQPTTIVPSGTTYTWTVVDNPNVTGDVNQPTAQTSISQTLTNLTPNTVQTVVYTVTPRSGAAGTCSGASFTLTVTVNPTPVIPLQTATICSGGAFAVTPVDATPTAATIVPSGTTYTWTVAPNTNVSGQSNQANAQTSISQTLTNLTNIPQTVVYTVTPASGAAGSCVGLPFTINVIVNPTPVVPVQSAAICSGLAFSVTPANAQPTTIVPSGTTYTWTVVDNVNVTGDVDQPTAQTSISQTLTNLTNTPQTVVYTVTPTSGAAGSCAGLPFTVNVIVNPTPVVPNESLTICGGTAFTINPVDATPTVATIVPSGTTYTWTVVDNPNVTGDVNQPTAQTSISQTLTNLTPNTVQTLVYTVTPRSGAAGNCVGASFTLTVTLTPSPVIPLQSATICSGLAFSVSPANATPTAATIVPSGTTYTWTVAPNTNVSGQSNQANAQTSISQTLTNLTNIPQTVVYTVTPTSGATGSCVGLPFTVNVIVNPTPVVPVQSATICSGLAFSVSPANAQPTTIVPSGTTYTWTVVDNPNVTGDVNQPTAQTSISQTLTNLTPNTVQTVVYTVTPRSGAAGTCSGASFTLTVTVNPTPVIPLQTATICSGGAFAVTPVDATPTAATIVPSGTTYTWTVAPNANVSGQSNQVNAQTSISQTLTNLTNIPQTVVYTVTPASGAAGSCVGLPFTINVIVNPTPVVPVQSAAICSGLAFSVTPANAQPTTIVPSGTTYTWTVVDNPDVSGDVDQPTAQTSISQTLTNLTNTQQTVVYTVTPKSGAAGSCVGLPFTITVTVNPTPVVPAQTAIICSGLAFSVTPANAQPTTIVPSGTTYTWTVAPNANVSGQSNQANAQTSISQTLTNLTNIPQTVVYTVTPRSGAAGSCVGSSFTVTVTVNPKPVVPLQSATICSGLAFSVSPANAQPTTIVPSGTTYTWTVAPNTNVSGQSNQANAQTSISQTLTNLTNIPQTVVYTVTPTSGATGSCAGLPFTVNVIVNPTPVVPVQSATICSGLAFSVSPANAQPTTIVPSGTTYTWTVVDNPNVTGDVNQPTAQTSISQTLTNLTPNTVQTVVYTVTPRSGAAGTCSGASFTLTVTVNPTPVIPLQTATICSGGAFAVTPVDATPTAATIVPSGTTYTWTVAPNANVSGQSNQVNAQTSISQTLTNLTNIPQTVVYTVTPTSGAAGSCVGLPFTVNVIVNPTPVVPVQSATICSGLAFSVTPANAQPTTIVPSGTTYTWTVVDNPDVSGDVDQPTAQTNISQTLTNLTNTQQTVVYTVTPKSGAAGNCVGLPFTITVTVNPTPVVPAQTATICSGLAFSVTPANAQPTTIVPSGTTYTWTVAPNANVSGQSNQANAQTSISQTLTNLTNIPQTVVYTVTPRSGAAGSCVGSSFTVTVTVNPKPVVPLQSATICSGLAFSVSPANAQPTTIVPSGTTYTWTVVDNVNVTGDVDQPTAQTSISQTLTNLTNIPQTVVYTVTPTSGAAGSCVGLPFTVNVIVNPTPVVPVQSATICSGLAFSVSPANAQPTTIVPSGTTYTWTVVDNPNVTGDVNQPTAQTSISQTLTNLTPNTVQTVVYTVTPRSGAAGTCSGASFTLTVTVNPTPVIPLQTATICSGGAFAVTPVDATPTAATIVPSGTTYTWTVAPNANVSGQSNQVNAQTSISQTLTNLTNIPQTVVYTVTPASGAAGSCVGLPFTINVIVNPTPVVPVQSAAICSGLAFTVIPLNASPTPATIVPANTNYTWTVVDNVDVTGDVDQPTAQTSISQTLTNLTNTQQTVVYTVTPTSGAAGSCVGLPFTLTVTLTPTPVVPVQSATICSGGAFAVTPVDATPTAATIVPSGTTYTWTVAPNTNVSGQSNQANAQTSISQTLTNLTNIPQTVVYTVTPRSGAAGSCVGSSFTVTVTVNPKPVVPLQSATICSGLAFSVSPANAQPTTIVPSGTTYTWTVAPNTNVSGQSNQANAQTSISQTLTNLTNIPQTVVYTVTPTSGATGSCAGLPFTVNVIVNPTPVVPVQSATICSGLAFSVSPANAQPTTIVPSGTTYTWTVVDNPNVTGDVNQPTAQTSISQTLTNLTPNTVQTVVYTVTPRSGAAGTCSGASFTLTVTVNPTPVIPLQTATICSGGAFAVTPVDATPTAATIVPSGTTYTWTVAPNANVSGQSNQVNAQTSISQTLTNLTNIPQTVVYTVTPTSGAAGSCVGLPFTVNVIVNPTPVVPVQSATICSGLAFSVTPANAQPTTIVPSGTTYTWTVVDNPDVSGDVDQPTAQTSISQTLTNLTNTQQTVVYTVTPKSGAAGSCVGLPFTITVTVNPTPVVPAQTAIICSGLAFSVTPANAQPTTIVPSGTTYTWTVAPNANVSGQSNQANAQTSISQTLTNLTNIPQTVVYTVTPRSGAAGSCVGSSFTVTVTVNPKPVVPLQSATICSGLAFSVSPANAQPTTIVPSGTTYTWTVAPNTNVSGQSNQANAQTSISQTLTNLTNIPQTVVYTVTPTSGAAGSCAGLPFTINVIVNPTPVVPVQSATICSGLAFSVTPANAQPTTIVPSGTTYTWTVVDNPNVTGDVNQPTAQTSISQTLTNLTPNTVQTVVYTVTPRSGAAGTCSGASFTLTVTVNPTPVIPLQTATICSGGAFAVTPVDATPTAATIVPSGTTYTWTVAPNANVSGQSNQANAQTSISQTLTNLTNIPQTVVYTVTPTSGAAGSCVGLPFTVNVIVNPTPVVPVQSATICSGLAFSVTPANAQPTTIVPSGTTYTWTVVDNPDVSGDVDQPTAQTSISQTLTNLTPNTVQTVVYTVTPRSGAAGTCSGASFTLTVTVNPTPVIPLQTATICSGGAFAVTPVDATPTAATIVPSGTTYTWTVAPNTNVSGQSNQANAQTSISQTLTNLTNIPQTVVYTVTPRSGAAGSCVGSSFTVTVTVNPKPVVPLQSATICSGLAFSVSPANAQPTTIVPSGTTYTWTVVDNVNVTGDVDQPTAQTSISQTLTNLTNIPQTVVYTVTPTSGAAGSCVGLPFTVNVIVNPTPVVPVQSATICSGLAFSVSPANAQPTTIVPSGTTYTWTVVDNPNVTGDVNQPTAQTSISQTLTNLTPNTVQTVVYTVTPRSGAAGTCSGASFTLTVTVNPTPVIPLQTATICSGGAFAVTPVDATPTAATIVPSGTTYTWTVAPNANVSGQSNQVNAQTSISQTLTNLTNIPQTVVYTVTPASGAAGSCVGLPFTINVIVNPTPVVPVQSAAICSGLAFSVTPANAQPTTIVPSGTTYTWTVVDNPDVSGDVDQPTAQTSISQTLTNLTNTVQTVVYTVTPKSGAAGSCVGLPFTVTVTINPKSVVPNQTAIACSGVQFTVSPVDAAPTTIIPVGTTYSWTVATNANVSGQSNQVNQSSISQTLTNLVNSPQTVIYTVTPISGTCSGSPFTVTVTVNPRPFIPNNPQLTDTRCSGDRFNIIPLNGVPTSATIVPAGTTYTWTVADNPNITGDINETSPQTSISQVLVNLTNTIQSVIYTVTPLTGSCAGLPFDVKFWVEPKPYIPAVLETICNNTEFILTPINNQYPTASTIVPTITKYTWALPTISGGVTGASTGTNALFFQSGTLRNSTPIVQTVIFQVYPSYYVTSNPNVVQCAGDPFTVTVRVNPNVTPNETITNVLCSDSVPICAGSIVLNPTGVGPFRYLWTSSNPVNPITNPGVKDQFNLCPGNYTVAITDLYNCTYTFAPFTIAPPTPIRESVVILQNISCNNINVPPCDGYIRLAISGGTPLTTPTAWNYYYNFEWYQVTSAGVPVRLVDRGTPILQNACEGNYRLKVTDANGCIFWTQIHTILKLFVPTTIVETVSNYNGWSVKCNGDSNGFIRTVISGGSGSYTYSFVKNGTVPSTIAQSIIPVTTSQLDFNGLPAGNYTLTITDTACPFSITRNYTLTQPPVLLSTVTPVAAILCNGGFATYQVVASGGTPFGNGNPYNYLWSPPSSETTPIATNLPAGPYAVTVTDANGCQVIKNGVITQPTLLVATATITTPISCFGGTATVTVSATGGTPGYTGTGTFQVTAGTHCYTVRDINNCISNQVCITVTEPPLLQVTAVITTPIRCFGGLATVTVTATGGNGSYTGTGTYQVPAGTHCYTVRDGNNCISSQVCITVTEPPVLNAIATLGPPISCFGGTTTVTISGTGGTPLIPPPFYTGAGTYPVGFGSPTYTITDANSCPASVTINVTQPTPVVATATIISPIKCHGGTAIISVTATGGVLGTTGYTGIGNFIVTAGTHCYTVRDGNNCISSQVCVTVTEPPLLVATAAVTSPILCNGGNGVVTVTVTGGTLTGVTPAYIITENGVRPNVTASTSTSFTIGNVGAGLHTYIITDANACTSNATINVTQPGPLAFTIKSANNPNCFPNRLYNNGSICITITGGTSPRPVGPGWVNTPALSNDWCRSGLSPGTYTIAVEDVNNCPSTTRTVTLTRPTQLTAFVTSNINVDCPTKNVSQTNIAFASGGVPGYFYTWSGGTACAGPPNPQCMTTSINGSYTVDVNDQEGVSLGCIPIQVPVTVNLPMIGNPLMSISSSAMSICGIYSINDPISFTNISTGNYTTIQWYIDGILQTSGANTVSNVFTSIGEHSITLVVNYTIGGVTCTYSVTEQIQVTRGYDMVVPNAFTPANHDGINDTIKPEFNCMKEVEMRVYDTWGSLLYIESGASLKGWDGTINGHESENGNYIIVVKATTLFGAVIDYNGPFTLLK